MADLLTTTELRRLFYAAPGPCVSIFVPAHYGARPAREHQMRFHNLLRRAGRMLAANGATVLEAADLLRPARELYADRKFWTGRADALTVFAGRDFHGWYQVPMDLPEMAVVGERFHLTPLLPLVSEDARFWILGVGRSRVQLIEASWSRAHGIDIAAVPPLPDPAALLHILPRIQSRLAMLLDGARAPLIIAAEDAIFRVVRPAITYAHVLHEHLPGDPDDASADELHRRAWKVMDKYFRRSREREAARLRKLSGTSRRTDDIRIIVPAAFLGRVASLFVSAGTQQWGTYDVSDLLVHVDEKPLPGDHDLVYVAALMTYIPGGKVFVVKPGQMPDAAPLTAAFQ